MALSKLRRGTVDLSNELATMPAWFISDCFAVVRIGPKYWRAVHAPSGLHCDPHYIEVLTSRDSAAAWCRALESAGISLGINWHDKEPRGTVVMEHGRLANVCDARRIALKWFQPPHVE